MAGFKMKSHRGASKRFRVTGSGKVKHGKAFGSHLLTGKPSKRMRNIKQGNICGTTEAKLIKTLLPYG